jgi:hypothetical protein
MASHGDKENLIHFTLVMRDFDEVIENEISNGKYKDGKGFRLDMTQVINNLPYLYPIFHSNACSTSTENIAATKGSILVHQIHSRSIG